MDKGVTQTNGPEDNEIDVNTQGLASERRPTKILCIKKRKKRNTVIERRVNASIQRLEDCIKRTKKDCLKRLVTSLVAVQKKATKTRKQEWEKTTVRIFQATNKGDNIQENLDLAKKEISRQKMDLFL